MKMTAEIRAAIELLLKKGIDCPHCGAKILKGNLSCAKCGHVVRPFPVIIGVLIIVAVLILWAVFAR